MKKALQLFVLMFLSGGGLLGCGMIGEGPADTLVANYSSKPPTCRIPTLEEFEDKSNHNESFISSTVNCFEEQVKSNFNTLKTQYPGELSIKDIRLLKAKGLVNLEIDSEAEWRVLGLITKFFHPEGREAISKDALLRWADWVRKYRALFIQIVKNAEFNRKISAPGKYVNDRYEIAWKDGFRDPRYEGKLENYFRELIGASEEFVSLLSPKAIVSLSETVDAIRTVGERIEKESNQEEMNVELAVQYVKAGFILKQFLLNRHELKDPDLELSVGSVRDLIGPFIKAAKELLPLSDFLSQRQETNYRELPQDTVRLDGRSTEWFQSAIQKVLDYFEEGPFEIIPSQKVSWSISIYDPSSELIPLVPDFSRTIQRLGGERSYGGVHPSGLLRIGEKIRDRVPDLVDAYNYWVDHGKTSTPWRQDLSIREILSSSMPIKDFVNYQNLFNPWNEARKSNETEKERVERIRELQNRKRSDYRLKFEQALSTTLLGDLVETVYSTFDENGDGRIPLKGALQSQLREAAELSYALLRFASVGKKEDEGDKEKRKNSPEPMFRPPDIIRHDVVYQLLGVLGDHWLKLGNANGSLETKEFINSILTFLELQDQMLRAQWNIPYIAQNQSMSRMTNAKNNPIQIPSRFYSRPIGPYAKDTVSLKEPPRYLSRLSVIHSLNQLFESYPKIEKALSMLSAEQKLSLWHGLTPINSDKPLVLYGRGVNPGSYETDINATTPDDATYLKSVLTPHYVSVDQAAAPLAIPILLEKLVARCDGDEDDRMSWDEMDCFIQPMIKAASIGIEGGLYKLDPPFHDLTRILLNMISGGGIPEVLVKMILANGSITGVTEEFMNEFGTAFTSKFQVSEGLSSLNEIATQTLQSGPPIHGIDQEFWDRIRSEFSKADRNGDKQVTGTEFSGFVSTTKRIFLERLDHRVAQFIIDLGAEIARKNGKENEFLRLLIALALKPKEATQHIFDRVGAEPRTDLAKVLRILSEVMGRDTEPRDVEIRQTKKFGQEAQNYQN